MSKETTIVLPKLEPWQMDVWNCFMENQHSTVVIKSKRQVGKTLLAICLLIKFTLEKRATSCIVEPTMAQCRRVFTEMVNMLKQSGGIESANASLLYIRFTNGSEILFKSAEQEDNLRGMTITGLLVIDEAAFIKDEIFDILFPCTDAHNAPMLIISTPLFKDGRFYELYMSENTKSFSWSDYDTSHYLSDERLGQYKLTVAPQKFISEFLGEFIEEGSFVFGDIGDCIRDFEKEYETTYIGIDWAVGNGGDNTVLTEIDDDGNVGNITILNNMQPTEQISSIANIINGKTCLKKVLVELNSIGSVYYDLLRRAMHHPAILKGFDTSNDSKRRIIENLIKAFNTKTISIPNNKQLISELQHYSVDRTKTGKLTYNGLGTHDDCVISLALAYEAIGDGHTQYTFGCVNQRREKREHKYR